MKPPRRLEHLLAATIATLILINCFTGCGLIPTDHKEQVAVRSAGDLESSHNDQVTKRSTIPQITIRGWGNKLDFKADPKIETTSASSGDVNSSGNDWASGMRLSKMPLWVKLVGTAIGLALLFFIVRAIIRSVRVSSPAAASALDGVESFAQREINRLKNRAMQTTDPVELAKVNADIAHLTEEKAKL